MPVEVDILENSIFRLSPGLLNTLLKDHTMSKEDVQRNIFWATSDYEHLGKEYQYNSPILPHLITGANGYVIMPRVLKSRNTQSVRSRDMAEVFTPSWICNAQNNLIDEAWFGRNDVFNTEYTDEQGCHRWKPNAGRILFPEGKTWQNYVRENRMEITCGEAPYLVSRYDATTGESIPLEQRIGLLDRKLRVVSENTATSDEWLKAAQTAYQHIYAYEWQGDSLLIARISMLMTCVEYFEEKFGSVPPNDFIADIADIISWNVWQMDGLKCVIPNSCHNTETVTEDLFGNKTTTVRPCEGCKKNEIHKHNGIYCKIKNWDTKRVFEFVTLVKPKS